MHKVVNQEPSRNKNGEFILPELPYPDNALAPHMSAETLQFHHGKHHATYVSKLNSLVKGNELAQLSLEDVVLRTRQGPVFNNAAQVWNHTFFWHCLSPDGGGQPTGEVADAIDRSFGSFDAFRQQFTDQAVGLFGSGWQWLVKNPDGSLALDSTANAVNPLAEGKQALLTCDVWEHAYYIDYRNVRAKFLDGFWSVVNWQFVVDNYSENYSD